MREELAAEAKRRLTGWGEIAAHLNVSEKTAARWSEDEQMPVHRHTHRSRASVFAYAEELDSWRVSRSVGAASPPAGDAGHRLPALSRGFDYALSGAFGTLVLVAVFAETAYQDDDRSVWLIALAAAATGSTVFSACAEGARRLARIRLDYGPVYLIAGAGALLMVLGTVVAIIVPEHRPVPASFQTFSASAAMIKAALYWWVLVAFTILPLHTLISLRTAVERGDVEQARTLVRAGIAEISEDGTVFVHPYVYWAGLAVLMLFSWVATMHLFVNLQLLPATPKFQVLVLTRVLLWFAIAGCASVWYATQLARIRRFLEDSVHTAR